MRGVVIIACLLASMARAQPGVPSPPLTASFEGPFGRNSGFPADTTIAAGPESLVAVINKSIALMRKDSTVVDRRLWDGFDPKVIFDPYTQRFVVLALHGQESPSSWLQLAVSKTATPANLDVGSLPCDAWTPFLVDADRAGDVQLTQWADFPGLGVDPYNVYVTANMVPNGGAFEGPDFAKVWVIRKSDLLAGTLRVVREFGGPLEQRLVNPVTGTPSFGIMPSIDFDGTAVRLLAWPFGPSTTLWSIVDPGGDPTLVGSDLPLPGFQSHLHPQCRQAGSDLALDTGFISTFHVVQRGGSVWASRTSPDAPRGDRSEIHWYQIDPVTSTVLQWGRVADPTRCYFYSAIQPDGLGGFALVMSGVGPDIFPSAFYTVRLAADPPGTTRDVAVLQAGQAPYAPELSGSTRSRIRWGDYGGIATDPVSGAFWVSHQFSGEENSWGTWIGALQLDGAQPATALQTTGADALRERLECVCAAGFASEVCGDQVLPASAPRKFAHACELRRRSLDAKSQHRRRKFSNRAGLVGRRLEGRLVRAARKGHLTAGCSDALVKVTRRLDVAGLLRQFFEDPD
jgi:hypothetical protein